MLRQPHARRDRVRRRARRGSPASTRRGCRRSCAVDDAVGTAAARRRRARSACPASVVVYAPARTTPPTVAVATGAFAAGPRRARDRHDERARRRGRRLPHRPRAPDPLDARARTSTATSCAPRTASAARSLEHVLERVVYADDELGDHRVGDAVRARSTPCSRATEPGAGGVMFLPWLGGSLAPDRERHDPRRLREHVARDRPRRPRARGRRGRRAQPRAGCCPHVEAFTGERDRRDRVRRRRGALGAVVPGARRRARPAGVAAARARRRRSARAMALLALAAARRASSRADLDRAAAATSAASNPTPRATSVTPYRQVQFEAAYAALLPISEALVMSSLLPVRARPTT